MYFQGDWIVILFTLIANVIMSKPYMYVIQQDNYRLCGVFTSRSLRMFYVVDLVSCMISMCVYIGAYFGGAEPNWLALIVMAHLTITSALHVSLDKDKKKPMNYTKRAVRSTVTVSTISTVIVIIVYMLLSMVQNQGIYNVRSLVIVLFPTFYPLIFVSVMLVANLFESLNNFRYEIRTKRKLSRCNAIKIAITGSYGKTSVKNYLHQLLSIKYNVLSTQESYNTPMGIAKTVNMLDYSHDVFIAEMGARRVGDIARLMDIIKPKIGILTGLNCQHLETFKTDGNIVKEKMHVIDRLEEDGFCIVNGSVLRNGNFDLSDEALAKAKFVGSDTDVHISDVETFGEGTRFKLHFGESAYNAVTGLLGQHNLENLALASAVAYELGIPAERIVEKIATIEPVKHRLQLLRTDGIRIIDDTYNSNPDGARLALDTLATFEGRKVVVTPGLVELGVREDEENRILGKRIALIADVVVLIGGHRSEMIRAGLGDFDGEVRHLATLNDAQKSFKDFIEIGDVVLLLNDLPDIYED